MPLAVGSRVRVWWAIYDGPPNMARVLEITPYRGPYKQWFNCILKLDCPGTKRGWLEMSYHSRDFIYEPVVAQ